MGETGTSRKMPPYRHCALSIVAIAHPTGKNKITKSSENTLSLLGTWVSYTDAESFEYSYYLKTRCRAEKFFSSQLRTKWEKESTGKGDTIVLLHKLLNECPGGGRVFIQ